MSTVAYAHITSRREEASPSGEVADDAPRVSSPPSVSSYVDAMSALVPSEVLAFHAIMVGYSTTTIKASAAAAALGPAAANASGPVTTITNVHALAYTFWVLIALSIGLYVVPHYLTGTRRLERWDLLRMLLPPTAFTAWTMLQRATAFDAIGLDLDSGVRTLIGLTLATLVAATASVLAKKADQQQPG